MKYQALYTKNKEKYVKNLLPAFVAIGTTNAGCPVFLNKYDKHLHL